MILFTKHASQQMKERGITKEQVKTCIKRGAKFRQGKNEFLSAYTYIRVAYVQKKELLVIKTVMVE